MASEFFQNPENVKRLFQEIADLKMRKSELEDELKKKEAIALAYMNQENADNVETSFGKFYRIFRKIYQYSPQVTSAEEQVKKLKKDEEAQGIATIKSQSPSIRFVSAKEQ